MNRSSKPPAPPGEAPAAASPPEEQAPPPAEMDRAARRRAKKLRRKAERAAARAAAENRALLSPDAPPEPTATEGFGQFGLRPELLGAAAAQGFERPTPIQSAAIPPLLAGRDVLGQSQTGTGKTAAFALPILQRIDPSRPVVQAIVLVPTRELANQVAGAFATLSRGLGRIAVCPIYGGQSIVVQFKRLDRGAQVVVGTPGRVMDHLRRGSLSLTDASAVVIDEADEMLKMGFIEDVDWILEHGPGPDQRQTALFSATLPEPVRRIADRHLTDPLSIDIEPQAPAIATVDQRFLWAYEDQKVTALCRLLEVEDGDATLVFTRTRVGASGLADALTAQGFAAEALHGDMSQPHRESVLRRLRRGDVRVVVATDVAARGLDVDTIALVVNFDAPADAETYVHRIGRTGRAGRHGVSVLFLHPREGRVLAGVQRFTRQRLQEIRPPTHDDVIAHRVERFAAAVEREIAGNDLGAYRRLVEGIARDGGHDAGLVAAAVARLAARDRPLLPDGDAEPRERPAPRPAPRPHPRAGDRPAPRAGDRPHPRAGDRPAPRGDGQPGPRAGVRPAPGPRPRASGSAGRAEAPAVVRLVISVGGDAGIGPGDVVGAIANEAGVPGRAIGTVDIRDRVTFVDVDARHVHAVLERLAGAKIRGRRAQIRRALPSSSGGRPRPTRGRSRATQRPGPQRRGGKRR